jgi:predicted nucleic acid-binding protein
MPIVIDSTVTVGWLFEYETSAASDAILERLGQDEAIVPGVWQLEVTNALLDAESRGRISEAQATRLLTLLQQLPITIDRSADAIIAVHTTALRHNLSAYQASYLVLAQQRALPLATADNALADAARAARAALVLSA